MIQLPTLPPMVLPPTLVRVPSMVSIMVLATQLLDTDLPTTESSDMALPTLLPTPLPTLLHTLLPQHTMPPLWSTLPPHTMLPLWSTLLQLITPPLSTLLLRCTPMRSLPTPTSTPSLTTTPTPTSTLLSLMMELARGGVLTPLLFLTAGSSTSTATSMTTTATSLRSLMRE